LESEQIWLWYIHQRDKLRLLLVGFTEQRWRDFYVFLGKL